MKNYTIALGGADKTSLSYDFELDGNFFADFDSSDILDAGLKVDVEVNRAVGGYLLDFGIEGEMAVQCDRCLEEYRIGIDFEDQLEVRVSDQQIREEDRYDGEVLWIHPNDLRANLAQYIYESVILSLPFQRVHPDNESGEPSCDKQMLERFRIVTQEEFDQMTEHTEQEMVALGDNPEFEKLKELKKKL